MEEDIKILREPFEENIKLRKQIKAEKSKLKFTKKIIKLCEKNGYGLYRNDIEKEKSKKFIIVLEEQEK